jgi:hypothetical protein
MFKALIKSKYHKIIWINHTIKKSCNFFAEVKNQDYITDTDMESWRLNGQYALQHIP